MKKISSIFTFVIILIFSFPQVVYANMAESKLSDIASSITFEKNDTISVLSEVLDITVNGSQADIVATYKMKNTTDKSIFTSSMFLSPNIKNSGVNVLVNNKETKFMTKSYIFHCETEVKKEKWQYVVLNHYDPEENYDGQTVDTINFEMNFTPYEEYEVVVSYTYTLGGYAYFESSGKYGEINYYLQPAAMWNNFSDLTINLYLDDSMPSITSSNLDFKKIRKRTYQFKSDTLPEENLRIVIGHKWWQSILKMNPYDLISLFILLFFIAAVLFLLVLIIKKIKKIITGIK